MLDQIFFEDCQYIINNSKLNKIKKKKNFNTWCKWIFCFIPSSSTKFM